jgi:hypothetical protein
VKASKKRKTDRNATEIGWREIVGLPDLGIPALKAKIDTGARTSALHAVGLETFERDGEPWVSFHVPLADRLGSERHTAKIVDERLIKNTSGVMENRYIVETTLVLGKRHWRIEVSLANRQNMELDLILGRTAVRRKKLLVNPGKSYLAGSPGYLRPAPLPTSDDGLLRTLKRGTKPAHFASKIGEHK